MIEECASRVIAALFRGSDPGAASLPPRRLRVAFGDDTCTYAPYAAKGGGTGEAVGLHSQINQRDGRLLPGRSLSGAAARQAI
jgi:hypothetical protein